MELIALHHSGDPEFSPFNHPEHNQGIPFSAIVELIEKRGLRGELD
jgi:hypothetical protein